MVRRYGLVTALLVLFVTMTPSLVLADDDLGRWNPTGTYVAVTEGTPEIPQDTVFLLTVIPGDKAGKRYVGIQNRINNFEDETASTMGIELLRTGKNSFDYELVAYSRIRDETGNIIIKNAWYLKGVFLRNEAGEFWLKDQDFYLSPGCSNILDPAPDCVVIGPLPLEDGQLQSQLGHGGPASGL